MSAIQAHRGRRALVLLVLVALAGTLLLGRVQGTSALPRWPGMLPPGQWRWGRPIPGPAQEAPGTPRPEKSPSLNWAVLVEPETIPACRREM